MRLQDIIEHHARDKPDAVAMRDGARQLTYAQLHELAESFADALVASGLRKGDRCGLLATNCLEYLAWYFGGAKAGVVTVPLNQRLAPPEWAYIANDSGCRLVVARNEMVAALDGVRQELPSVERFVGLGDSRGGWEDWDAWLSATPPRPAAPEPIGAGDPAVQMYTSGTTGRPKGAVLSHGALMASLTQLLIPLTEGASSTQHVVMPFSHMGSTIVGMLSLLAGGNLYVQEVFDPPEVVRILDEEGINRTTLVPAMIQALLVAVPDVAEREYRDLEVIGYGAAPIALETLQRAMAVFGCDFFQGFGQTESSGSIAFLTQQDHRRATAGEEHLLLSTGRAAFGTELRVLDEAGHDCAPGEVGEIVARGPQVMSGYWNMPEETASVLRDGWLHTGDAGTLDEEGFLYIKDRIRDLIVSGGENVYPAEVEQVLYEHEAVAEAAVIGVPDERWGETVKACVVLRPGASLGEEELVEFCRSRIAGFKVPRSVDFMDALPRNATMKVLKHVLRAPYWEGHTRAVS